MLFAALVDPKFRLATPSILLSHTHTDWGDEDDELDAAWVAADPSTFLRAHIAGVWTAAGEGVMRSRDRGACRRWLLLLVLCGVSYV